MRISGFNIGQLSGGIAVLGGVFTGYGYTAIGIVMIIGSIALTVFNEGIGK